MVLHQIIELDTLWVHIGQATLLNTELYNITSSMQDQILGPRLENFDLKYSKKRVNGIVIGQFQL